MEKILIDLLDRGFTIFFAVVLIYIIWYLAKKMPEIIKAVAREWGATVVLLNEYRQAITENKDATLKLSSEIKNSVDTSRSVLDELKELKHRLEAHDIKAEVIENNQEEMLELLKEIKEQIELLSTNK